MGNSDITSEQSGWVSNSSRQSSGSSSGQISPELDIKQYPIKDMLTATSAQFKLNGTQIPKNVTKDVSDYCNTGKFCKNKVGSKSQASQRANHIESRGHNSKSSAKEI